MQYSYSYEAYRVGLGLCTPQRSSHNFIFIYHSADRSTRLIANNGGSVMPKQLFQRPSNVKLGNPGKNNKFGGQPDWGRKKGKPERIKNVTSNKSDKQAPSADK